MSVYCVLIILLCRVYNYFYPLLYVEIIPVDLNSILYKYELNLAYLQSVMIASGIISLDDNSGTYSILSTNTSVAHSSLWYKEAALNRSMAMQQVLYDADSARWMDYNITAGSLNNNGITSISSYVPLWAGVLDEDIYGDTDMETLKQDIFESFLSSGLHQTGGMLTTTQDTGQQWDAPNAWPPLVWFTIEGLVNLNMPQAFDMAVSTMICDYSIVYIINNALECVFTLL